VVKGGDCDGTATRRLLDSNRSFAYCCIVTLLQLKRAVSRLPARERRELAAYLIRLWHQGAAWRRLASKRMRDMDTGRKVPLKVLEQRLAHS
jgi:hypothetical protein